MKIAEILYSPEFIKNWRKLPKTIQEKAIKKERLFKQDAFSSQLKTHKLAGNMSHLWAFSIDYHWRIVFYLEKGKAVFVTIGTHRVYG